MTLSFPDKAKVNAKRTLKLLSRHTEESKSLIPSIFIFQQVGAPAPTAKLAQYRIATNYSEFIAKD